MHWIVCSVYYLGCMVVNINAIFAEWSIIERDYFQIFLFGILSSMEPSTYLFEDIDRCSDGHFPGFYKHMFPQPQDFTALVLSGDCTEVCCSSTIVIFNKFLVFNFSFFNFEQQFSFSWISIPPFPMLYSTIN